MNAAVKILLVASHELRKFEIADAGKDLGFYLYVYQGEKCTHDYLQDTMPITQQFAFKKFGVPLNAWRTLTQ